MGMDLDLVEVLVMVVLVEVLVMGDLEDITTMKQQPLKLQKPITLLSTTTITQSLLLKTYLVVFLRTTLILDMLRGMMEESLEVDMMMMVVMMMVVAMMMVVVMMTMEEVLMMVEETLILETLGTKINIIFSSLMIYVPLFKHKYKNDIKKKK